MPERPPHPIRTFAVDVVAAVFVAVDCAALVALLIFVRLAFA